MRADSVRPDVIPPISRPLGPSTALVCGLVAVVAGLVVLLGWLADLPRLTDWAGTGISTLPNTALASLFAGASLAALARNSRRAGMAFALGAGVLGVLTTLEHLVGIDVGIDRLLLVRDWGQHATVAPGRMGPPAAAGFSVLGASLALLAFRSTPPRLPALGGFLVIGVALLSLVGYAYGADVLFAIPRYTAIAGPTSVVLLTLGAGLVVLASGPAFDDLVRGTSPSSITSRRLIPILVLLPISIGWVRVDLQRDGLIDFAFGAALRSVLEVVLLLSLLWWTMRSVKTHESALRLAHAGLERQSRQLETFLETAVLGLHRADPLGRILWANDAELRMLGYPREEYVGRLMSDFFADPAVARDILARLHDGQTVTDLQTDLVCKDGSRKTVLIDCSVLREHGEFVHTQCFTRDVTAQRRAEAATARLAAIVEFSDDAIVSKTLDGVVTSWNRGAERIFGYSEPEVVGRNITLIIPPDRLGEEAEVLAKLRRGESIEHFETVRRRKDGTEIHISLTVSPIRDAGGRIIGASKVARDISERKRIEAALVTHQLELERHRAELEHRVEERTRELVKAHDKLRLADRMAAVGTLASGLAHDMKNVLLPLGTRLDALLATRGLPGDAAKDLAVVCALLDHLKAMASNLSLFAKDPAQDGAEGRTELPRWCERVRGFINASAGTDVHIDWQIPENLPDAAIAPHRLTQAVMNLVHNARDAVLAARSRLAAPAPRGQIVIHAGTDDQGRLVVSVTDNGCGMSEEVRRRCLEPFFTTKDRPGSVGASGGTGLGLSLAHAIVERVGGSMEIESEVGQGTSVVMKLPPAQTPALPGRVRGSARVELRDPRRAALTRHLLSELGYEILSPGADRAASEAGVLWITDRAAADQDALAVYLRNAPGRRVVLFWEGEPGADAREWAALGVEVCRADESVARMRSVLAGSAGFVEPKPA